MYTLRVITVLFPVTCGRLFAAILSEIHVFAVERAGVLVAALVRQVPVLVALHDGFLIVSVLVFVILVPSLAGCPIVLVAVQIKI